MNIGKTVFAQIIDFIPIHEFRRCVRRYRGNRKLKSFSCWDQFLAMAFAQLTFRESLRDIETCLRAIPTILYHMGFRGRVSRSTLADANESRDWRIYDDFAQVLIHQARVLYADDDFGLELKETVYAIDSTTIDLCLSLLPWAMFRKKKAAVKLHTLLDLRGAIPSFIKITEGKIHDVRILDDLIPEPGYFYLLDRGYLDFARLYIIQQSQAFFVIRAKSNLQSRRTSSRPINRAVDLRCDQTIVLSGVQSRKDYPDRLRRIRFYDRENDRYSTFLTNNFILPALTIAMPYKLRWHVGASSQARMIQPVKVRSRLTDSKPRSTGGAVAREQDGEALRQRSLKGGCATLQVVTYSERRRSPVTRKLRWPSRSITCEGSKGGQAESETSFPHRRGISGDMERRVMRKLEKPSTPAEEISAQRPGL